MPNFKPIRQPRVSEEVFRQLKEAILSSELKAGDKLPPERELAEEFQVSRVAIREAIRTLENAGFVAIRQGATGGAYVTDLTFEQLASACLDLFLANKISTHQLQQVRLLIEPEVARLATLNANETSKQRLLEAYKAEYPPRATLKEDIVPSTRVHFVLADMCGNPFLEAIVNSVIKLNTSILEVIDPVPPYRIHPPGVHEPIVDAVLAGDSEGAAQAMRFHAESFFENISNLEKEYRNTMGSIPMHALKLGN